MEVAATGDPPPSFVSPSLSPTARVKASFVKGGYGGLWQLADPNNFVFVRNGQKGSEVK